MDRRDKFSQQTITDNNQNKSTPVRPPSSSFQSKLLFFENHSQSAGQTPQQYFRLRNPYTPIRTDACYRGQQQFQNASSTSSKSPSHDQRLPTGSCDLPASPSGSCEINAFLSETRVETGSFLCTSLIEQPVTIKTADKSQSSFLIGDEQRTKVEKNNEAEYTFKGKGSGHRNAAYFSDNISALTLDTHDKCDSTEKLGLYIRQERVRSPTSTSVSDCGSESSCDMCHRNCINSVSCQYEDPDELDAISCSSFPTTPVGLPKYSMCHSPMSEPSTGPDFTYRDRVSQKSFAHINLSKKRNRKINRQGQRNIHVIRASKSMPSVFEEDHASPRLNEWLSSVMKIQSENKQSNNTWCFPEYELYDIQHNIPTDSTNKASLPNAFASYSHSCAQQPMYLQHRLKNAPNNDQIRDDQHKHIVSFGTSSKVFQFPNDSVSKRGYCPKDPLCCSHCCVFHTPRMCHQLHDAMRKPSKDQPLPPKVGDTVIPSRSSPIYFNVNTEQEDSSVHASPFITISLPEEREEFSSDHHFQSSSSNTHGPRKPPVQYIPIHHSTSNSNSYVTKPSFSQNDPSMPLTPCPPLFHRSSIGSISSVLSTRSSNTDSAVDLCPPDDDQDICFEPESIRKSSWESKTQMRRVAPRQPDRPDSLRPISPSSTPDAPSLAQYSTNHILKPYQFSASIEIQTNKRKDSKNHSAGSKSWEAKQVFEIRDETLIYPNDERHHVDTENSWSNDNLKSLEDNEPARILPENNYESPSLLFSSTQQPGLSDFEGRAHADLPHLIISDHSSTCDNYSSDYLPTLYFSDTESNSSTPLSPSASVSDLSSPCQSPSLSPKRRRPNLLRADRSDTNLSDNGKDILSVSGEFWKNRSGSVSSISSDGSTCSTCTLYSDSDTTTAPRPKKQSSWRKIRSFILWSPFIQVFKKHRYPWIQLAGHQGNFQAGDAGSVLKKLDTREMQCFQKVMSDSLRLYVPEYRGNVDKNGETFIQLQDLLCTFTYPCVMDIKMGVRTYLEEELHKARKSPSLRKDMYQKMVEVDTNAPTAEEHEQKAVTKPRYMQWRDEISSSVEMGFRVEGIKRSDGNSSKDFKKTKTKENIVEIMQSFVGTNEKIAQKYVERLQQIRRTQESSDFFNSHEVVGSSLLFVHDADENVNVWMIDFGKTEPLPAGVTIDHRSTWVEGNREDGYLFGLDNLVSIFDEICKSSSSSSV